MKQARRFAWLVMLIADVGLLVGRDGSPGTGFSAGTRLEADLGCRLRGLNRALLVGNTIAFVSAMTYDWTVGAIGPFELTEYWLAAALLLLTIVLNNLASFAAIRMTLALV